MPTSSSASARVSATSSTLRRRRPALSTQQASSTTSSSPSKRASVSSSFSWLALCALLIAIVPNVAVLFFLNYRVQQTDRPSIPFNVTAAQAHLQLISARKRYVGTAALQSALQYIHSQIEHFKSTSAQSNIHLDLHSFHSAPSSFHASIGTRSWPNSYDNLPSIVARLRPSHLPHNTSEKALLINAHVDSAFGSYGANDNVVGVALALQLIHTILHMAEHQPSLLSRPIVFLFNGAEETVLTGAHSFVTQHQWAPTIVAHINLESMGSGDSYFLFRLGPNNPWLARAYAKAVSIPSASVTATDIFSSKLIPAETDFRVFDEFANIPGFDFVLLDNGYIYHTAYDSIEHVNHNSIRHGALTVLELALELAGANDAIGQFLEPICTPSLLDRTITYLQKKYSLFTTDKDTAEQKITFFDILHYFTIVYDEVTARFINACVLLVTLVIWAVKILCMRLRNFLDCIWMCFTLLATILPAFASSSFAALVYSSYLGLQLRWYGSWHACLIMFGPPALFGVLTTLQYMLPRRLSSNRYDQMLFAVTVLYSAIAIVLTKYNVMSSYIPIALVLVADICAIQGSHVHPMLRHVQMMLVHGVLGAKQLKYSLVSTLPLMGRIRSETVPHDMIAALIVSVLTLIHFVWSSLPILCHYALSLRRLRALTFAMCVATAAWLLATARSSSLSYGAFLYNERAPKRALVIHFYSPQLEPSSVISIGSLDPVEHDVERMLSKFSDDQLTELHSDPRWGKLHSTPFESHRLFQSFVQKVHVFKATVRPDLSLPEVTVTSEERTKLGWNLTVAINAPDAHVITMRMDVGSTSPVTQWSLGPELKDETNGTWVSHAGSSTMNFWVVIGGESEGGSESRPKLNAAVTCSRLGASRSPKDLQMLSFEKWEAPSFAVSNGVEVEL